MSTTVQQEQSPAKTIIGTGLGNALEWYDWLVYATFTPFIAAQIFRTEDPTAALLSTLAIFAVGFLARPLGGVLFGWLADAKGRKFSLVASVALASLGALLIAVIPPFATIGVMASFLLLVARLIQGLAHGGELPSAQTYLNETAPRERRGLWSSLIYISGTSGILLATVLGAILTTWLPTDFMSVWGWRIPFLLASVLGLYTLIMRARLEETEHFEQVQDTQEARTNALRQLLQNKVSVLKVIGLTVGFTVAYYVWSVTAPTYASGVLGMDKAASLWSGIVGNVIFIAFLPLWGALSDRIGRKPVLLIGTLGTAAAYWPMNAVMDSRPWTLIVAMSVALFFLSAVASIAPAVYSELFPTTVRTLGTALPYAIAVAVFGGTAPYLQTFFSSLGAGWLFSVYAIVLLVISAGVVVSLKESKGMDLHDH
jgi:MHS family alpha-ketoglutarate permease-like MFS transporter